MVDDRIDMVEKVGLLSLEIEVQMVGMQKVMRESSN